MSDKAQELAEKYIRENAYPTQEYGYQVLKDDTGEELADLIDAALADERSRCAERFQDDYCGMCTDGEPCPEGLKCEYLQSHRAAILGDSAKGER